MVYRIKQGRKIYMTIRMKKKYTLGGMNTKMYFLDLGVIFL